MRLWKDGVLEVGIVVNAEIKEIRKYLLCRKANYFNPH